MRARSSIVELVEDALDRASHSRLVEGSRLDLHDSSAAPSGAEPASAIEKVRSLQARTQARVSLVLLLALGVGIVVLVFTFLVSGETFRDRKLVETPKVFSLQLAADGTPEAAISRDRDCCRSMDLRGSFAKSE